MLRQWLAPGNAVASRAVADVAVGQDLLIEMLRTNGQRRLARGLYLEVAPLRRLVHTWRWDGCEIETLVTIEVEPKSADTGIRSGNCDRSRRAEIHRVPARDDLKVPGQRPFAGHRSRPTRSTTPLTQPSKRLS